MSQYDHPSPTSFLLDEERSQVISSSWSDEHESVHDWEVLAGLVPVPGVQVREACPGMLQSKQSLSVEETTLVNIQPVGRYGLTPVWEMGIRQASIPMRDCVHCANAKSVAKKDQKSSILL